jgi:hypothetical protein
MRVEIQTAKFGFRASKRPRRGKRKYLAKVAGASTARTD